MAKHARVTMQAAEDEKHIPLYERKSKKMRTVLIVIILLLVVFICAGGALLYQLFDEAQNTATQQAQQQTDTNSISSDADTQDSSSEVSKLTTVPDLVSLVGLSQDEAIEILSHGAEISAYRDVNEEDNPVKTEVTVSLTDEPSDDTSGSPSVYLSLNDAGVIIEAGYSVATSSIGYGSISFVDAIENESIIEKTLEEAGLSVSAGSCVLPSDKTLYSTYATDGTTLTKEYYSFTGNGTSSSATFGWMGSLSYDYTVANATSNLADTIRTIYVYVSAQSN
jgi:cytoskeletal protein RodZ